MRTEAIMPMQRLWLIGRQIIQYLNRWPEWLKSALGLLLLTLPAFLHVLLRPQLIASGGDLLIYYYWEHFTREQLSVGQLPLWNPYILAGYPAVGNPQVMIFYPPALALRLLPLQFAFGAGYMLHVWWAGLGMYWLVRQQSLSVGASCLAAIAFMFSGFIVPRIEAGHVDLLYTVSWLPWAVWLWQRTLWSGSARTMLLSSIVIGLQFLAGHPATLVLTLLLLVVVTVHWVTLRLRPLALNDLLTRLGLGVLASVVVAGGFAFQLLPTVQLIGLSTHAAGFLRDCGLPVTLTWKDITSIFLASIPFDVFLPWERNGYFGALALVLALIGLAARSLPDPTRFKSLLVAALIAGLILGINPSLPFTAGQHLLPAVSSFRVPVRFMLYVPFAGAGLAAIGFESLLVRLKAGESGRPWPWVTAVVLAALAIPFDAMRLIGQGLASSQSIDLRQVVSYLVATTAPRYALSAGALRWIQSSRNVKFAVVGALVVLCADLWVFSRTYIFAVPITTLSNPSGWIETIDPTEARLVVQPYMFANGSMVTHTANAQGYASIIPAAYANLLNRTPPSARCGTVEHVTISAADSHALKLLSVRYLISATGPLDIGLPPIQFGLNVYELSDYWPRAQVVGRVVAASTSSEAIAAVEDPDFDPTRDVVIEGMASPMPVWADAEDGRATAKIVEYRPLRVRVEVESPAAGMLMLNDVWYPGWRASVNGVEAPVYRANGAFRAVPVPAGRSEVTFTFQSDMLMLGWGVSVVTWGLVVAAVLATRLRRGAAKRPS